LKISIIIPAFNEEQLLGESLSHVKTARDAFTTLEWKSELIVCDNNSTDYTADIARAAGAPRVQVGQTPARAIAARKRPR
jgi:glycosyltransferase involved in cell wall biosynthesis